MNCSICNSPLHIIDLKYETELDSTDIYAVMKLVCVNNNYETNKNGETIPCLNYAGKDLNHPKIIAKTIRNKV